GAETTAVVSSSLKVSCVFHGHFHFDGEPKISWIQKFIEEDSWVMFWPYFRQFVSDVTARMSIPPELLPLALNPGEVTAAIPPRKETFKVKDKQSLKLKAKVKLKPKPK